MIVVSEGRVIALQGKLRTIPLFKIEKREGFSEAETSAIANYIADYLNDSFDTWTSFMAVGSTKEAEPCW